MKLSQFRVHFVVDFLDGYQIQRRCTVRSCNKKVAQKRVMDSLKVLFADSALFYEIQNIEEI